ncbi:MAG: glycosyltransferase family 4 protein [Elusimicrobiota bacterium]
MKIVFITSTLDSGGAERVLAGYANWICRENEVIILKFDSQPSFYEINEKIKVINLGLSSLSSGFLSGLFNNLKRVYFLKKTLKSLSPDIILSFQTQTNIVSLLAAKIAGFNIYIFERTNHLYDRSLIWPLLRRTIYPLADKLFVLTSFDEAYYRAFVKKVVKMHNPVFVKAAEKNNFEKKEKVILASGRFDENKQFGLLIKIFAGLEKNDYRLIIAGDGPLKGECEKIIKDCGLSGRVELAGKTHEMEELYSKARIFCLTSLMEGFPNVLLEAMSFGCVPIAFDCISGPNEIIENGIDGFLVKPYDSTAFSQKLSLLISDASLLKKMSEKAFFSSKRFSPEKMMVLLKKELS